MSDQPLQPAGNSDYVPGPLPVVVSETDYLRLVNQQGWDYVQRKGATGVVTVMASTPEDRVVFVEQYRIPVGANVIEFPAGLAGDLTGASDESLREAAERELLEETGYQANRWTHVMTSPSSAGLTDELISFFLAEQLERVGPGGGDDSESIRVHEVDFARVDEWLMRKQRQGKLLDARLYTGLYLMKTARQQRIGERRH